jgi:hypothetical protein
VAQSKRNENPNICLARRNKGLPRSDGDLSRKDEARIETSQEPREA